MCPEKESEIRGKEPNREWEAHDMSQELGTLSQKILKLLFLISGIKSNAKNIGEKNSLRIS